MAAVGDEQGRPAGTDRDGERYRPPIGFAEPEQQGDQPAGDEDMPMKSNGRGRGWRSPEGRG